MTSSGGDTHGAGADAERRLRSHGDGAFKATRRLLVLEVFGTPHLIVGRGESGIERMRKPGEPRIERLWSEDAGPSLLWPSTPDHDSAPVAAWLGEKERGIPVFAEIVPDGVAETLLARAGAGWKPVGPVVAVDGTRAGSIWRADDGSVFLPFDPDAVQLNYLSERYREILVGAGARRWKQRALRSYYRARGWMPKAVQIWLRRRYAPIQARGAFPRWPVETGLHDFWEFLGSILTAILGRPVPRIAAWPDGAQWALVLTHDVEGAAGVEAIEAVATVERAARVRSSWNLVPQRDYEVPGELIGRLVADGFEVGVHGLYHDGRDLESEATLRERLPGMREAAARWNAVGFRSPSTHRGWKLMRLLGFDYDSSYPDTDPFEPQAGGCCTWLPFFNGETIELPLTMPQDHTLFVILRHRDERVWVEKAEFLRSRGGMALMVTHPDYLGDGRILGAYERFLNLFADDPTAWKALPREVSAWWRRRAASSVRWNGAAWEVTGPAAGEARIEFAPAPGAWLERVGGGASGAPGERVPVAA